MCYHITHSTFLVQHFFSVDITRINIYVCYNHIYTQIPPNINEIMLLHPFSLSLPLSFLQTLLPLSLSRSLSSCLPILFYLSLCFYPVIFLPLHLSLTSSQSALTLRRRKITSPAFRLSSRRPLPLKSNTA